MLKLILPRTLLNFVDSNKGTMSRPIYIIKCIDYIMRNNINLINEGDVDERIEGSSSGREGADNHKL